MEIEALKSFIAITETGSFTGAGLRVGRTQSAVSQQIRKLEDGLGCKLLVRSSVGTELTVDGHRLLPLARDVVDAHARAEAAFGAKETGGRVSIGLPELFADRMLPILLPKFQEAHPQVEISITQAESSELLVAVRVGQIDMALYTDAEGASADGEALYQSAPVWVAPKSILLEHQTPLPVVVWREGSHYRRMVLGGLDRAGIPYRVALTTQSTGGMISAIAAGIGVGLVLRFNVTDALRMIPSSVGLPVAEPPVVYLTEFAGAKRNPVARDMAAHIRSVVGGMIPE